MGGATTYGVIAVASSCPPAALLTDRGACCSRSACLQATLTFVAQQHVRAAGVASPAGLHDRDDWCYSGVAGQYTGQLEGAPGLTAELAQPMFHSRMPSSTNQGSAWEGHPLTSQQGRQQRHWRVVAAEQAAGESLGRARMER